MSESDEDDSVSVELPDELDDAEGLSLPML